MTTQPNNPSRGQGTTALSLPAPAWATEHRNVDGVTWYRDASVDIARNGEPRQLRVRASMTDELSVSDGHVSIARGDVTVLIVDDVEGELSPSEARRLAEAILSVVDAVDGSR